MAVAVTMPSELGAVDPENLTSALAVKMHGYYTVHEAGRNYYSIFSSSAWRSTMYETESSSQPIG